MHPSDISAAFGANSRANVDGVTKESQHQSKISQSLWIMLGGIFLESK